MNAGSEPGPETDPKAAHLPARPHWRCRDCGQDWPCPPARRRLRAEFGPATVSLGLYLGGSFVEACQDLPEAPTGMLYDRFLGWLGTQPDIDD